MTDEIRPDTTSLLTTKQAAEYLGIGISTLEQARVYGSANSPKFVKLGRSVRYRMEDLQVFVAERLRSNTTSRTTA